MSDDTSLRAPQDASRIAMGEDYEVRYWTNKFGVSRERCRKRSTRPATALLPWRPI